MDGYERAATILKALAHPARLRILQVLGDEGEACVCHLERRLNQRQAYISQHLAKLRKVGLVRDRREGLNVFYAPAVRGIDALLDAARELAVEAARAEGTELSFRSIIQVSATPCSCPKCEKELRPAAGAAQVTMHVSHQQ